MVAAYFVYLVFFVTSLALTWCGVALLWRGDHSGRVLAVRRVFGALAIVFGGPLIILNLNVLPSWLHEAGLLHTTTVMRSAGCSQPIRPGTTVDPASGNEPIAGRRCSVEWVANISPGPAPEMLPAAADCVAVTPGTRPAVQCYSLATIEFDERGRVIDPSQITSLLRHAATLTQAPRPGGDGSPPVTRPEAAPELSFYVIAYVHGWRHSADAGDGDVRRLRVVAANAVRNLAERCQFAGRYCQTQVLAIYAAWPGATTIWDNRPCDRYHRVWTRGESEDCFANTLGTVLNALSFPPAKAISDQAGHGVMQALSGIRSALGQISPTRMLLLGHSLGGNLILSGVIGLPIAADGAVGPADLTVLLNPATEASKWARVDKGYGHRSWSDETPPRIVYLTAPCSLWPPSWIDVHTGMPLNDDLKGRCDNVVDTFFAWSQRVVTGTWFGADNPDVVGAGHAVPTVDGGKRSLEPTFTHWVDLNVGSSFDAPGAPTRATTYADARSPAPSCFIEPSFLYCARERGRSFERPFKACGGRQGPLNSAWDFGSVGDRNTLGRIVDDRSHGVRQANVQLATGAFRGDRTKVSRISPIWGIRSGQSAVRLHGGIASAPILCLFNKLLLDDASRRPGRGEKNPGSVEAKYWAAQGVQATTSLPNR